MELVDGVVGRVESLGGVERAVSVVESKGWSRQGGVERMESVGGVGRVESGVWSRCVESGLWSWSVE